MSELFTSQIGLLSLFTILFVIVIAVFYIRFFSSHIAEDERRAAQREKSSANT